MRPPTPPGARMGVTVPKSVYADTGTARGPNQAEQYESKPPAFFQATDEYLRSPIGPGNEPLRWAVLNLLGRTTPCQ